MPAISLVSCQGPQDRAVEDEMMHKILTTAVCFAALTACHNTPGIPRRAGVRALRAGSRRPGCVSPSSWRGLPSRSDSRPEDSEPSGDLTKYQYWNGDGGGHWVPNNPG